MRKIVFILLLIGMCLTLGFITYLAEPFRTNKYVSNEEDLIDVI